MDVESSGFLTVTVLGEIFTRHSHGASGTALRDECVGAEAQVGRRIQFALQTIESGSELRGSCNERHSLWLVRISVLAAHQQKIQVLRLARDLPHELWPVLRPVRHMPAHLCQPSGVEREDTHQWLYGRDDLLLKESEGVQLWEGLLDVHVVGIRALLWTNVVPESKALHLFIARDADAAAVVLAPLVFGHEVESHSARRRGLR